MRSLHVLVRATAALALAALGSVAACGDDTALLVGDDAGPDGAVREAGVDAVKDAGSPDASSPTDADAPDASGTPDVYDAACAPITTAEALAPDSTHVPEGTAIVYATNPPSSGQHYPVWANFAEYAAPVDDGYLVHSMEHGAVVIFHKCASASCPEVVTALRAVRDSIATDPGCDPSIRVRVILAPRPTLDVPIAAAAWGYTYKAQCVDAPSLTDFVRARYAKAPEDFCSPGRTF